MDCPTISGVEEAIAVEIERQDDQAEQLLGTHTRLRFVGEILRPPFNEHSVTIIVRLSRIGFTQRSMADRPGE